MPTPFGKFPQFLVMFLLAAGTFFFIPKNAYTQEVGDSGCVAYCTPPPSSSSSSSSYSSSYSSTYSGGPGGIESIIGKIFKALKGPKRKKNSEPANVRRSVELGDRAVKIARKGGIKNVEKALDLLERALEEDPTDFYGWTYMALYGVKYYLGLLYFQQKNFDKALAYLTEVSMEYPGTYEKLVSSVQFEKQEYERYQAGLELVSQVSKQPPDISPTLNEVNKGLKTEKMSSLLASLQQSLDVGKNGEIFDSGGPVVMTSQGTIPDTSESILFSKGTTDSAPVQTDGSRPPLTGEKLNEILQTAGMKPLGGINKQEQRTQPEDVTPRNVRLEAKAIAALRIAYELAIAGDFATSELYFRQVRAIDPDCTFCRIEEEMYQRALELLKDPEPITIDDFFSEDLRYRHKADYILDALDYGHGSWASSLRYMEHMALALPDDRNVLAAKNYLEGLVDGLTENESEQ